MAYALPPISRQASEFIEQLPQLGIGGAILAAPVVAAGRDLYRYGFHRLGGQVPAVSFDLTVHGSHPAPSGEPPGDASEPASTA